MLPTRPRKMKSFQRRLELLRFLEDEQAVAVSDLSKKFDVSEMTVGRDLKLLEARGLIIKAHGGAITRNPSVSELSFREKRDLQTNEKRMIARQVLSLVSNGSCVILDSGTTTGEVARELSSRDGLNLTVVTNALNVANILHSSPHVHLILLGGSFRETSMAFMGPMAEEMLTSFRADLAVIGAEGVDLDVGVTVQDLVDANIKKKMMASSRRAVVVADHTKLGQVYMARVSALQDIDALITGTQAAPEFVERARLANVSICLTDDFATSSRGEDTQ